jgi:outer membrane immunogenic protein
MKISLLVSAGLVASLAGPVMAADVGPAKAPEPPDYFSWTGCYVGADFGSRFVETNWATAAPSTPAGFAISTQEATGIYYSGQGGCNYQFSPWAVLGVQGDYGRSYVTESSSDSFLTALTDVSKADTLASVTGRLGLALSRFLGYVKGGVGWTHDEFSTFNTITNVTFSTASDTRTGWVLGGGLEYGIVSNLSMFVEYDFYNFGTRTDSFTVSSGGTQNIAIREHDSIVKVGMNWTFR